jgi:hypothetical protein
VLVQVGPILQAPPQPTPAAGGVHQQRLHQVASLRGGFEAAAAAADTSGTAVHLPPLLLHPQ